MLVPFLTVEGGPLDGRTFRLGPDGLEIGREMGCDIAIPDPAISRHHCTIEALSEADGEFAFRVRDLGSSNGTYLNDSRIDQAKLKSGDQLRVGTVVLTYRLGEEPSLSDERLPATFKVTPPTAGLLRGIGSSHLGGALCRRSGFRSASSSLPSRRKHGSGCVRRSSEDGYRVLERRLGWRHINRGRRSHGLHACGPRHYSKPRDR